MMIVRALVVGLSWLWAGCSANDGSERGQQPILGEDVSALEDVVRDIEGADPLIHVTRWEDVDPATDPVRSPELTIDDRCPAEAVTIETTDDGLYLDVDTTDCNWVTVSQTTLLPLSPGDTLRVWAFRWANLTAPGQGRFVVAAGSPPASRASTRLPTTS